MNNLIPVFICKPTLESACLLQNARPCPSSGASIEKLFFMTDRKNPPLFLVTCGYCDYSSTLADSMKGAVRIWNWGQ